MKHRPSVFRPRRSTDAPERARFVAMMGAEIVRYQEETEAFDMVAARVLALERSDLPCMTLLLFGGPSSVDRLGAALHQQHGSVRATLDRLLVAGYARRRPGGDVELTEHAREWIERIWAPVRDDGRRLLDCYSTRDLATMSRFMAGASKIQAQQVRRLRTWLQLPARDRQSHLRGGLSPAALRRVQVFVESNLERPIQLPDLARRAGLTIYHFARAFKASAGITPRAFVEQRRIECARRLIDESAQSLAQVAVRCGFGTQSRLTSTFKRSTGFTPGQYRRGRRGVI